MEGALLLGLPKRCLHPHAHRRLDRSQQRRGDVGRRRSRAERFAVDSDDDLANAKPRGGGGGVALDGKDGDTGTPTPERDAHPSLVLGCLETREERTVFSRAHVTRVPIAEKGEHLCGGSAGVAHGAILALHKIPTHTLPVRAAEARIHVGTADYRPCVHDERLLVREFDGERGRGLEWHGEQGRASGHHQCRSQQAGRQPAVQGVEDGRTPHTFHCGAEAQIYADMLRVKAKGPTRLGGRGMSLATARAERSVYFLAGPTHSMVIGADSFSATAASELAAAIRSADASSEIVDGVALSRSRTTALCPAGTTAADWWPDFEDARDVEIIRNVSHHCTRAAAAAHVCIGYLPSANMEAALQLAAAQAAGRRVLVVAPTLVVRQDWAVCASAHHTFRSIKELRHFLIQEAKEKAEEAVEVAVAVVSAAAAEGVSAASAAGDAKAGSPPFLAVGEATGAHNCENRTMASSGSCDSRSDLSSEFWSRADEFVASATLEVDQTPIS